MHTVTRMALVLLMMWVLVYTYMGLRMHEGSAPRYTTLEGTEEVTLANPVGWKQDKPPLYKQALESNRCPVLITFATGKNYGPEQIHFFANSFQRWAPWEAKIVFFTDDGLVPSSFTVPRPHMIMFVNASAVPITRTNHTVIPVIRRFFIYEAWLKEHANEFSSVYLADSRDLFFQADLFEPITERGLYFFEEAVSLAHEPFYNQVWIRDCYGNEGRFPQC